MLLRGPICGVSPGLPKKRWKKSCIPLSSSSSSGCCCCGCLLLLRTDGFCVYSLEILTTDGSNCFASCEKALDSCPGFGGTTKGVAPGATTCSFAAFTPVETSVPITTPIDNVNRIRLKESNFCLRILSKKLMSWKLLGNRNYPYYTPEFAPPVDRCSVQ